MSKIRAEFYNNLIDRISDSKLEAETRLEEELVEKIFFAINTVVERQGETKEMIQVLRYKAVKAHIESEFFNEVIDKLEKYQ